MAIDPKKSGVYKPPPAQPTAPVAPVPATATSPSGPNYLDLFKGHAYFDNPDFQNIVKQYQDIAGRNNALGANERPTYDQLSGYADNFAQQFKNYVGRDPNSQEYGQFFKTIAQDAPWARNAQDYSQTVKPEITGLLKDYFTRTAQDEAQKTSQTQAVDAIAPGSAFDTWQNSYRNSLTDVESSLQDYQSRLFEKLRPQLLTSLKAQGLLDTGALNTAFAGAAKDLTDANTNYMTGARSAVDQDIANRKYELQSAPSNFAMSNTFNTVPNLTQAGTGALNQAFQAYMQDANFRNQRSLLDQQRQSQPSPLSQYAGLIVGGLGAGFGQGVGNWGSTAMRTASVPRMATPALASAGVGV